MVQRSHPQYRSQRATAQLLRTDAPAPPETRIGSQIQPQVSGCWLWRGRSDRYGRVSIWDSMGMLAYAMTLEQNVTLNTDDDE